ncbi:carboxypeptidase-like regulatory domain-containing protein [Dactylosporangium sp. CA-092794]|uniref:carboxypeptidase-like regulatory domain-containing protein n=1 Tax=Dactylosporangium sp. CA-092794 TaxID=3239929 RepID=UPI003D9416D8
MPEGAISAATEALLRWAAGTGLTVAAGPPVPESPADAYCWLLNLLPEQQLRANPGGGPLRLRLRYMLCAGRPDDLEPLDLLLRASVGGPYEPVFEPVPAGLWEAVRAVPRPAFHVDVVTRLDRPRPATPLVRETLRLVPTPLRELTGVVLGPGDVPLPGLRVETGDGLAAAHTDAAGRFALPGLPADRPIALRLTGRGRQFHHQVPADDPRPAVIRCEFRED